LKSRVLKSKIPYADPFPGLASRGVRPCSWKTEEEDAGVGFSVREEDEEEEGKRYGPTATDAGAAWDGMDMDMEMD